MSRASGRSSAAPVEEKTPLLKTLKRRRSGRAKPRNHWTEGQIIHLTRIIDDLNTVTDDQIACVTRLTKKNADQVKRKIRYLLRCNPSSKKRARTSGQFSGMLIDEKFFTLTEHVLAPDDAAALAFAIRNILAPQDSWSGVLDAKDDRRGKFCYSRADGSEDEKALFSVLDEAKTHIIQHARALASKWALTQIQAKQIIKTLNEKDRPRNVSACLYQANKAMGLSAHVDIASVCTVVIGLTRDDDADEGLLTFWQPSGVKTFRFVPGLAVAFGLVRHEVHLAKRKHDRVTLNIFF